MNTDIEDEFMDTKADLRTPVASVLTPQQLWREISSLKEFLLARIDAVDAAMHTALGEMARTPTDLQKEINHLKELMEVKIRCVDDKFATVIVAIDKATAAQFAASEKAIAKSEEAQKELNIKNNEFRAQLKDQADVLMPRNESLSNWKSAVEKVNELKEQTEIKLDLIRKEIQVFRDSFQKDIQVLRESRSEIGGRKEAVKDVRDYVGWGLAVIASLIALAQYIRP